MIILLSLIHCFGDSPFTSEKGSRYAEVINETKDYYLVAFDLHVGGYIFENGLSIRTPKEVVVFVGPGKSANIDTERIINGVEPDKEKGSYYNIGMSTSGCRIWKMDSSNKLVMLLTCLENFIVKVEDKDISDRFRLYNALIDYQKISDGVITDDTNVIQLFFEHHPLSSISVESSVELIKAIKQLIEDLAIEASYVYKNGKLELPEDTKVFTHIFAQDSSENIRLYGKNSRQSLEIDCLWSSIIQGRFLKIKKFALSPGEQEWLDKFNDDFHKKKKEETKSEVEYVFDDADWD